MRKAPSLRNNNGALQVRVRLDGKDHFINRLGRWDDPVARARTLSISAEIWRDYREGTLDWRLWSYKPLVDGKDPVLLKALASAVIKVPHRGVQESLSKSEIQKLLEDIRLNQEWFYPCFAVCLGTGLRNAELIGLTCDCLRLEEGELLISNTFRRDGVYTHKRQWSGTKTGKSRVVPLRDDLVLLLQEHKAQMEQLSLGSRNGLVLVTTHGHLYASGLELFWKRSQRRVGLVPRRLYAQRHSFLSHALAMGNSPADLAAVAGRRTEQLLYTY